MRIIRFINDQNEIRLGRPVGDASASVLQGDLFGELHDSGEIQPVRSLLAPLVPSNLFAIGLNYRMHTQEAGMEQPVNPVVFMKNSASVTGDSQPVIIPGDCIDPPQIDYEGELAVVIGREAKNVPVDAALDYVFGYTIANDVSARRWQKHAGANQWVRGKSFDTFCPLGPELVTADELTDPQDLRLTTHLNDQLMQDGSTGDMIYSVAELVSYLSQSTTLLPGTVILTGTPDGVGFSRNPPVYLKPGDQVAVSISEIGTLRNIMVADKV